MSRAAGDSGAGVPSEARQLTSDTRLRELQSQCDQYEQATAALKAKAESLRQEKLERDQEADGYKAAAEESAKLLKQIEARIQATKLEESAVRASFPSQQAEVGRLRTEVAEIKHAIAQSEAATSECKRRSQDRKVQRRAVRADLATARKLRDAATTQKTKALREVVAAKKEAASRHQERSLQEDRLKKARERVDVAVKEIAKVDATLKQVAEDETTYQLQIEAINRDVKDRDAWHSKLLQHKAELVVDVAKRRRKAAARQVELETLTKSKRELVTELEQYEEAIRARKPTANDAAQRLAKEREELTILEKANSVAKVRLSNLECELLQAQADEWALAKEVESVQATTNELQTKVNAIGDSKVATSAVDEELAHVQDVLDKKREELESSKRALDDKTSSLRELQVNVLDAKDRRDDAEARLDLAREQYARLGV